MSSIDALGMAVRNLFKRKLRSFLTVLGVIVGTAAIVIMISLGIGMNNTFMESLSRMGDLMTVNVYMPYNYSSRGGGGCSSSHRRCRPYAPNITSCNLTAKLAIWLRSNTSPAPMVPSVCPRKIPNCTVIASAINSASLKPSRSLNRSSTTIAWAAVIVETMPTSARALTIN